MAVSRVIDVVEPELCTTQERQGICVPNSMVLHKHLIRNDLQACLNIH